MTSILDNLINLLFLVIGILIGLHLQKEKLKNEINGIKDRVVATFIKPSATIIDSKEENSLNKLTDDVNMHHNNYFDEPNEPVR